MKNFARREFLRAGTGAGIALAGGGLLGPLGPLEHRPGIVSSIAPARPTPSGFYRFQLGGFELTVLDDGRFTLPAELFGPELDPDRRAAYQRSRFLPAEQIPLATNPVVVDTGSARFLVDAGTGDAEPPSTTGRLAASLTAAGIPASSIDGVILTHAHGDHIGGLVDPERGTARYPDAEVVASEVEHGLWTASDVRNRVPGWVDEWGIVDSTRAAFSILGDRVRTIPFEGEVATGIRVIESAGHTPGHVSVLLESEGETMILVGDAVASTHMHMEQPEWHFGVDHDPDQGARTRRRLLERIAGDRLLVHGFHFPFPGLGRVVPFEAGYRWLPQV